MRTHVITLASALALSGCSLLGLGGAGGGGKLGSLAADPDDPPRVRNALEELDQLEAIAASKDWESYSRKSSRFQTRSALEQNWAKERKGKAIQERIDALDAAAYQAVGGRLAKTLPTGARVLTGVAPAAITAAVEMLEACEEAASTSAPDPVDAAQRLRTATARYEQGIARVQKLDAKALHYLGSSETKRGSIDVPNDLLLCEAKLAAVEADLAETYVPERPAADAAVEIGCGVIEALAEGVLLGGGKFAPYRRTEGGTSLVERVACTKVPKRDQVPAALAVAAKELREHLTNKDVKIVVSGAPYTEVRDEDLHTYRFQRLLAYSKTFQLASNPCGELDVFCEAGGSKGAAALNRIEFALARAAATAGVKSEVCTFHLKQVGERAAWFEEFRTEQIQQKSWKRDATYRTRQGKKLTEPALVAAFSTHAKVAADRLAGTYCTTRPAK